MLGKLIKYEFKATGRVFLPLFGALLLLALVSRLFISLRLKAPSGIGIALSVFMIIAVFVITLIITLQRFYKNLLTNEGYLMFTLPVSTDSIIWSKLIVAAVWNILSIVAVTAAVLIMAVTESDLSIHLAQLAALLDKAGINTALLGVFISEFVVLAVASLVSGILMFYACMSVSLLMNRNRILFSFAAFLVFYTVGQILTGVVTIAVMASGFPEAFMGWSRAAQVHFLQFASIALNLIVGAVFYVLSRYMLKYRLNLE